MSLIFNSNNVAVSAKSKALITTGNAVTALSESPAGFASLIGSDNQTYQDIAMWGRNNRLPMEMITDIEATDVLFGGIDAKARIAIGKGPRIARVTNIDQDGNEVLEFVQNTHEAQRWLSVNNSFFNTFSLAKDLISTGNAFVQILLNRKRDKIVAYRRHDPTECRLSKRDIKTRKSEWVYISGDWTTYANRVESEHFASVPLLDPDFPVYDLQSRNSGYTFIICIQYPLSGRQYYAPSPWFASRAWAKIAQGIPAMKEAMFKNQLTLKNIIEVHPKYWEVYRPGFNGLSDEEKREVMNKFWDMTEEFLVGGENAYKSLFSTMIEDHDGKPVSAITVVPVDDKIKDGKLLPDGAAANSQMLFSLLINPALMGVDIPGGGAVRTAGSGSNIREAYLVQVMQLGVERELISAPFNLARDFNGWDTSLVQRFPNQILTTLNTGANSQPIA